VPEVKAVVFSLDFDFNDSICRYTHSNILLCIFQQELHCYQDTQYNETSPP